MRTCDLRPFIPPVVAQIDDPEDAASALENFMQSVAEYLRELKTAVCEDLEQLEASIGP